MILGGLHPLYEELRIRTHRRRTIATCCECVPSAARPSVRSYPADRRSRGSCSPPAARAEELNQLCHRAVANHGQQPPGQMRPRRERNARIWPLHWLSQLAGRRADSRPRIFSGAGSDGASRTESVIRLRGNIKPSNPGRKMNSCRLGRIGVDRMVVLVSREPGMKARLC